MTPVARFLSESRETREIVLRFRQGPTSASLMGPASLFQAARM